MKVSNRQLINSVALGVAIVTPDGQIDDMNHALLDMLGYEAADVAALTLAGISAEADIQVDQKALQALTDGRQPPPYIKELANRAGDLVPVEIHAGAIHDGKGDLMGAVLTVRPLSEEMKLLKSLQRRSMQLLASSEVARSATQILDVQELLTHCVDLIRTHFGFYYAAIFLIDDTGEWAWLRAATGEAGKKLLEVNHKLGVGSQSMVGWVTANNAARIALDVGEERIRFDNPYLPRTRSEIALPLRVRGAVIGALDAQSTSLNAFTEEDIQTIQMMADQVAIAIDNARLFSGKPSA
ncbi:MAG: GAF domain-containing protein [Anaerolineae bacterium]|nr:GAF domain-containing protein [Anaerolineae bacterium]